MTTKRQEPTVNRATAPRIQFGFCQECGKRIVVRNNDGMISRHIKASDRLPCRGANMAPGKAAGSELVEGWTAPRRTN